MTEQVRRRFARNDVASMRSAVMFDGPERTTRLTRFWTLLLLAAVIAAVGVLGDSTATVIGAMIVAPMMLPIQATMLSVVLGDRTNLIRSVVLVVAGATAAVAIGYLIGLLAVNPVVAATNGQVAARVTPNLVDLVAALATGAVGSIALIRKDISDTLPGVAIAISLVPPLSVVGLTLESRAFGEAVGALLLFLTNVAAILVTGILVMVGFGVHRPDPASMSSTVDRSVNLRVATVTVIAMVLVIGVPLTVNTVSLVTSRAKESTVTEAADPWATAAGWHVVTVTTRNSRTIVTAEGGAPAPQVSALREQLVNLGVSPGDVTVVLVPTTSIDLAP